jgi:DMSO/TMAO reductase YedYZ molybdopterin-dependent catalytic subunit
MVATHDKRSAGFARRTFLGGLAASALPLFGSATLTASAAEELAAVIRRQVKPDNLEFPFSTLDSFITPNEQFYVRTHFEVPELSIKNWKLRIEGAVEKPFSLDYDELRKMPSHTLTSLLECSGNSRVFLKPPQVGIRWELGGVSNAEWTGVRLSDILERAGVKSDAAEVILEGADHSLRTQLAHEQSASARGASGLPDEWRGPAAQPRLPGTSGRSWLVRHGLGEVVEASGRCGSSV